MDERLQTGIVVGVDGSAGSDQAVRFAALEAARHGSGLLLVHVVPDLVTAAPPMSVLPDDLRREVEATARALLAAAAETAAQTAAGVPVAQAMPAGRTVPGLIHAAEHGSHVVLGRETVPPVRRLVSGAVTLGVAARAPQSVVSVPASWSPERSLRKVVAGYKSTPHSGELLAVAFAEADARHAHLVLVHAWALDGMYDDRIVTRTRREEWSRIARDGIEGELGDLRTRYPGVPVEVRVVHGTASAALSEATSDADLLVLVRRPHGFPPAIHLGSTARALLHAASCPVLVLPPQHAEHTDQGAGRAAADLPLGAGQHH
jgi:nucleotide-binding universal stress UspA family protein